MKHLLAITLVPVLALQMLSVTNVTTYAAETNTDTIETLISNEYSFNVSVVDESNKKVDNVHLYLQKQAIEWISEEKYVIVGEKEYVADWNTSDVESFVSDTFTSTDDVIYVITSDILPEGYSFYGNDTVEQAVTGALFDVVSVKVELQHDKINQENDIQLSGNYSLQLNVADIISNENIGGLECELFELGTKEVITTWNTSDEPIKTIEGLAYSFDKPDSYSGNIRYAIRITNLPENYVFFYGKSRDFYGVSGFGLEEFANGNEVSCTVYLEDTSEEAPKYSYVTNPVTTDIATTTTTTTTFAAENDDTKVTTAEQDHLEYPLIGRYSMIYNFVDAATGNAIENLDCIYINAKTGEEVYSWNTSEEPVVTISDLKYCFESAESYDSCLYALKITNMPENYIFFNGKSNEIIYSSLIRNVLMIKI